MPVIKPADYGALAMRESPDAVLVLSHDGEILHWSAGAEAVFGTVKSKTMTSPFALFPAGSLLGSNVAR